MHGFLTIYCINYNIAGVGVEGSGLFLEYTLNRSEKSYKRIFTVLFLIIVG